MKKKKILIIGGAGFIGHNIALALDKLGANVHLIDSLQVNNLGAFSSNLAENPQKRLYIELIHERLNKIKERDIPLHILDARDYGILSPAINKIKPDVVIHLAAVAHANRSNKDPFSTFDHSLRTLENALDSVKSSQPHFIYFSSSMVYGNFDGDAVKEDRHCKPMGIYGALKYAGEQIVTAYNQVFGLPYTIIRPSALYGERCVSRRVGQAFIENALRGQNLSINGDGNDSLDFTYIDDLVQGVIKCIENRAAQNEIFNLTFGSARSLNDLAQLVQSRFPSITINHNPPDKLMPERGTLSIEKAQELIGYKPDFPVERGFERYLDWYCDLASKKSELFELDSTN